MTRAACQDCGFSLIELVVALSVAALISVLLLGGYAFAGKAWNRTDMASDATGEIYTAQSTLRRAFGGLSLDVDKVKFAGNAGAIGFVTLFALPGDPPAPTELGLAVDQCADGPCLMLTLTRPEWAKRNGQPVIRAPLVHGVKSAAIAYRGKGPNAPWQADWPIDKGAPALVRIDVALAAKSARRWPTLYLVPPSQS